jgi:hypothetical protein
VHFAQSVYEDRLHRDHAQYVEAGDEVHATELHLRSGICVGTIAFRWLSIARFVALAPA